MERKIGETFEYEGKTLQVKAANDDGCEGCIFNVKCTRGIKSVTGLCESGYRDDKKDVIFVEVKERKIGEVFESRGKKLKVTEHRSDCVGCFFDGQFKSCLKEETGECGEYIRSDHKSVIFVEVKDEQQQEQAEQPQAEQQPQRLNLCEILKDCPKGEMFWSPVFGDVWFYDIDKYTKRVKVKTSGVGSWYINADGTITIDKVTSPEIMLYPSRKQRDWSKFTAPWLKKEKLIKPKFKVGDIIRHKETNKDDVYEISKVYTDSYGIVGFTWMIYMKYQDQYELVPNKFNPNTLKPFDKVLVRSENIFNWNCSLFSNIDDFDSKYPFTCLGLCYKFCIPYNDETKHLVGTTEEAPDFYRYWED